MTAAVNSLGGHNVVRFGNLRFWAERGLIHCEDARNNEYKSYSVRAIMQRVKAVNDMLANSREELRRNGFADAAEWERQMKMVERMVDVCAQAQVQGMPTDPSARRDLVRRRPHTVVVPDTRSLL